MLSYLYGWFSSWLITYVPSLIDRPKWFHSDSDINVGGVVLFLKVNKNLISIISMA